MPYRLIFIAISTLAFSMLLFGCGRKAPPVAPSQAPLIRVSDLRGELTQGSISLTWNHPSENAKAVGYIVLRAQSAVSKPDCPDCPVVYQKVATVPITRSLRHQQHIMTFDHLVADGFHYIFSVRPIQNSGSQGPDSNLIKISYPKAKK